MKVQSKILISQDPQRTEITLLINNGLSIIRQNVDGDHRLTADDIASEIAMREFYKEHFADKFQNEEIEKLDQVTGVTNSAVVELTQMLFTLSTRLTALESANKEVPSNEDNTSEA